MPAVLTPVGLGRGIWRLGRRVKDTDTCRSKKSPCWAIEPLGRVFSGSDMLVGSVVVLSSSYLSGRWFSPWFVCIHSFIRQTSVDCFG